MTKRLYRRNMRNNWEAIVAALHINGAAAHIHQVTLFGLVFHLRVFIIYHIHQIEFIITAKITI